MPSSVCAPMSILWVPHRDLDQEEVVARKGSSFHQPTRFFSSYSGEREPLRRSHKDERGTYMDGVRSKYFDTNV